LRRADALERASAAIREAQPERPSTGSGARDEGLALGECWPYGVFGSLRTGNGGVKQTAINATTALMTAYSFDSDSGGL